MKNILDHIQAINFGHKIKVRTSLSKSGRYSLFLEHYIDGVRSRLYPKIILYNDPKYKSQDEAAIRLICALRDEKETVLSNGGSLVDQGIIVSDMDLSGYAEMVLDGKQKKNADLYRLAVNRFLNHYPDSTIKSISLAQANSFFKSISKLSHTTQHHYIRSLSYICKHALNNGIIKSNPFAGFRVQLNKTDKQYLTLNELKTVIDTECDMPVVKRAFLFACFTGLRIGDVSKLTSDMIQEGYLVFRQNKTGSYERMKLLDLALYQIDITKEGLLFDLPTYKYIRSNLQKLIAGAGITKHITFHCARHTFATMCLTHGTDLYTVSKLLGHSDVRVTQVYAKLVDQVKDSAIDNLNTKLR